MQMFNSPKLNNAVIFSPNKYNTTLQKEKKIMDEYDNIIRENADIKSQGCIYTGLNCGLVKDKIADKSMYNYFQKNDLVLDDPTGFYNIINTSASVYDYSVAENLKLSLAYGNQLTKGELKNDIIPVIMKYQYRSVFKLNKIYEMGLYWYERGSEVFQYDNNGNITNSTMKAKRTTIKVKVVGFLNKENYTYDFSFSGTEFPTTYIYRKDCTSDMILLRTPTNTLSSLNLYTNLNSHLLILENANKRRGIESQLKSLGSIVSFSEVRNYTNKLFNSEIKEPLINFLICFIISVIFISGINLLVSSAEIKDYGIYYMCGCRWIKCFLLDVVRSITLIIIPAIFSLVFANIYTKHDSEIYINFMVYCSALGLVMCMYLLSSLFFNIKVLKNKPVDCLREIE
jgi:hypothetical protein